MNYLPSTHVMDGCGLPPSLRQLTTTSAPATAPTAPEALPGDPRRETLVYSNTFLLYIFVSTASVPRRITSKLSFLLWSLYAINNIRIFCLIENNITHIYVGPSKNA